IVDRHRTDLSAERDRLEAMRLEQVRIAGERTDLMRSAGELRERELQLARRGERLSGERGEAETEAARLLAGRTGIRAGRGRALGELATLGRERDDVQQRLQERARTLAETEAQLAEARLTLAARDSSLEALRQLERAREGYGAGVRAILAEGASAPAGIVGTVADLLDGPGEVGRGGGAGVGGTRAGGGVGGVEGGPGGRGPPRPLGARGAAGR